MCVCKFVEQISKIMLQNWYFSEVGAYCNKYYMNTFPLWPDELKI